MIDALPGDIFQRGQILNNTYEIEGVLGRGGTGEVYRARNMISGRIVAIKALNKQFSGNDAYVDLMKREEQMRDIMNDAVVRYTECSRSDQGDVFLVMDFIDGPSVNDVMTGRRMEPRELMIIAHRVAEGLVAAHRHGIVHRDLSPDNVILRNGNPDRATIIDFGIAKDTAAGARTIVGNDFAGKYEYAAPEQLEGRAEARSDLYSLGALLLAAFRGQIPFAGATPGEMVRRKQGPLDTIGVPEPLKGAIEWLAAPKPADRPASAEAVVARLDALLKTGGPAKEPRGDGKGGKRALLPLLLVLLLVPALGAGAYFGGLLDRFFTEPVPVASPYLFIARSASPDGPAQLSGNAPDAAAAERLSRAFATASKAVGAPDMLAIAEGMPSENWPAAVEALLAIAAGQEEWSVSLSDRTVRIEALARDRTAREATKRAFDEWAGAYGFAATQVLEAGPRNLGAETVAKALQEIADCGALVPDRPPGESYGFGDTIRVTGDIAAEATAGRIKARLDQIAGDRKLSLAATVLNEDLCAVRKVLPDVPTNALSIWMADGETLQPNLSGVFRTGDNPVVEIQAPATLTEGTLFVAVIDNTGKVFNILPNVNDDENDLIDLGIIANGVRRIRVLNTIADLAANNALLAMQVSAGNYGKSEVVAILSRSDLFAIRRPRDESIASFAEALAEIQKQEPGNIVALATRLLDSRP